MEDSKEQVDEVRKLFCIKMLSEIAKEMGKCLGNCFESSTAGKISCKEFSPR